MCAQEVAKLRWLPVDVCCAIATAKLRAADHRWTQAAAHALRSKGGAERARQRANKLGVRLLFGRARISTIKYVISRILWLAPRSRPGRGLAPTAGPWRPRSRLWVRPRPRGPTNAAPTRWLSSGAKQLVRGDSEGAHGCAGSCAPPSSRGPGRRARGRCFVCGALPSAMPRHPWNRCAPGASDVKFRFPVNK